MQLFPIGRELARGLGLVTEGWHPLHALDRAIGGARRLIVVCLQDAGGSMGSAIASSARGWPRASHADPVEDVLQHSRQISGQPALIMDVGDPGRPQLYSIPAARRSGGNAPGWN